jgi:Na+-translocating ferredoxin:NAD+ oxidoreductase RnfC subunit
MREYRLVPTERLVARLGLTEWEHQSSPLDEGDYKPERVSIPLRQHIGAPAKPVVTAGSRVSVGDLIAKIPGDALGANVHASISGKVARVDERCVEIEAG